MNWIFRLSSLAALVALLAACGDDGASAADAGFDASLDGGFDAGPVASYLFGPCYTDEQCPGADGFCRLPEDGWPQGYCTRPCPGGDRGPCDDGHRYNHCLEQADGSMECEMKCLGGVDCRDGYTCTGRLDGDGNGMCVGLCSSDEQCGGGEDVGCNEWSGECMPVEEIPAGGAETGEACGADEDCLGGNCIPAYDPSFSGWNGGYCIAFCILPQGYNTNTLYVDPEGGTDLPTGTCAGDAVCFPNGSYTRGDLGVCFSGCRSDADCRNAEGYECNNEFQLSSGAVARFTRGVCLPIDCRVDACPSGFECRTLRSSTGNFYRCEML